MVWALFCWNLRKSLFRWSGRKGDAPCQNRSDSGRAMQTGCEACASWNSRARFQRVCPLLTRRDDGVWVCRVDAAGMKVVKQLTRDPYAVSTASLDGLELFFLKRSEVTRIESILPGLSPLSLELNYALLDRYL